MNQQEPAIATPKGVRQSHHKVLPPLPLSRDPLNDLKTTSSFMLRRDTSDNNFLQPTRQKPSTRHQRSFSFRPGDDAKSSDLQNAGKEPSRRASVIEPDTDPLAARTLPGSISLANDTMCDVRPLYSNAIQHTIPTLLNASRTQTSSPPSSLAVPQRDDSGRSTITVIRHNPSRRSSTSAGDAVTSSSDFQWQELGKGMRHNMAAVAAARAASEGLPRALGPKLPALVGRQSSHPFERSQSKSARYL